MHVVKWNWELVKYSNMCPHQLFLMKYPLKICLQNRFQPSMWSQNTVGVALKQIQSFRLYIPCLLNSLSIWNAKNTKALQSKNAYQLKAVYTTFKYKTSLKNMLYSKGFSSFVCIVKSCTSVGIAHITTFGILFNVNLLKGIIYNISALKCLKTTGLVFVFKEMCNLNEAICAFPLPFEQESALSARSCHKCTIYPV